MNKFVEAFTSSCSYTSFLTELFKPSLFSSIKRNGMKDIFLSLDKIKRWSAKVLYFIKSELVYPSAFINKSRLKNIFLSTINDYSIWNEINKMIDSDYLTLSLRSIFSLNGFGCIGSLSLLLFNVYLLELDNYVLSFCSYFGSSFLLYKRYFYSNCGLNKSPNYLLPIKVSKLSFKDRQLPSSYKGRASSNEYFCFYKNLYYTRYLNYFLFGIFGSDIFLFKLRDRILSYTRGNLRLEFADFSIVSSFESSICFCGYKLVLAKLSIDNLTNQSLIKRDSLRNKIIRRFSHAKLNFSRLLLVRVYRELFFYIKSLISSRYYRFFERKRSLVCLELFLLEAIYSFVPAELNFYNYEQNYNSLLSKGFNEYFFNSFLFNMKKVSSYFDSLGVISFKSGLPIDLSFTMVLDEFSTRFSFLYFSLCDLTKSRNITLRSYFSTDNSCFSGLLFSDSDILFSIYSFSSFRLFTATDKFVFKLSIPVGRIISKLRSLGFVHSVLNRPIGNVGLISLEDFKIIGIFNYLFRKFLFWYKRAFDYYKIVYILSFLKKSCLLTLSRKHRKSKSWSYTVYVSFFDTFLSFKDLYPLDSENIIIDDVFFLLI